MSHINSLLSCPSRLVNASIANECGGQSIVSPKNTLTSRNKSDTHPVRSKLAHGRDQVCARLFTKNSKKMAAGVSPTAPQSQKENRQQTL